MDKKRLYEWIVWVLFGAFLLLGVYNQISARKNTADYLKDAALTFEEKLEEADKSFKKWLKQSHKLKNEPFEAWYALQQSLKLPEEIIVWENDSLVFWSGTRLTKDDMLALKPGFVVLENLIGYCFESTDNGIRQLYVVKLKNNYAEENQYLKNELLLNLDGSDQIRLLDTTEKGAEVKDRRGITAFKISLDYNQRSINLSSRERYSAIYFMLAIAFAILLFFLRLELTVIEKRPWYSFLEFLLPLIVIRVLLFRYRDSIGLASLELFDPKIFASHWLLPSFGDLLLHLMLIVLPLAYLFRYRLIYHYKMLEINGFFKKSLIWFIINVLFVLFFLVEILYLAVISPLV